jgi:c-di-GMP-binding flagellar brake protein YcgR
MGVGTIYRLPLKVQDPLQVSMRNAGAYNLFDSRVEELAADELLIRWPTEEGERIPVRELQVLTISFGPPEAAYEVDVTVLALLEEPIPLLAVRPLGPLRHFQRRNDVRARVLVSVELTAKVVKLMSFKNARRGARHIVTETQDISAGGFTIHHQVPLPVGTLYDVRMVLPGEHSQPLLLSARVVRCVALEGAETQPILFASGFAWSRISEAARAHLARFVFGVQRD